MFEKKLVYVKNKSKFNEIKNKITNEQIVFIESSKEIYNRGTFYGGKDNKTKNITDLGKGLFYDPTFEYENNFFKSYTNRTNNDVSVYRNYNNSGFYKDKYSQKIHIAGSNLGDDIGGFEFNIPTEANGKLLIKMIANIPVGYNLEFSTISQGTGYYHNFLTEQKGTGDWEEYLVEVNLGSESNKKENEFYFYLNNISASETDTVDFYLIYFNIFERYNLRKLEQNFLTIEINRDISSSNSRDNRIYKLNGISIDKYNKIVFMLDFYFNTFKQLNVIVESRDNNIKNYIYTLAKKNRDYYFYKINYVENGLSVHKYKIFERNDYAAVEVEEIFLGGLSTSGNTGTLSSELNNMLAQLIGGKISAIHINVNNLGFVESINYNPITGSISDPSFDDFVDIVKPLTEGLNKCKLVLINDNLYNIDESSLDDEIFRGYRYFKDNMGLTLEEFNLSNSGDNPHIRFNKTLVNTNTSIGSTSNSNIKYYETDLLNIVSSGNDIQTILKEYIDSENKEIYVNNMKVNLINQIETDYLFNIGPYEYIYNTEDSQINTVREKGSNLKNGSILTQYHNINDVRKIKGKFVKGGTTADGNYYYGFLVFEVFTLNSLNNYNYEIFPKRTNYLLYVKRINNFYTNNTLLRVDETIENSCKKGYLKIFHGNKFIDNDNTVPISFSNGITISAQDLNKYSNSVFIPILYSVTHADVDEILIDKIDRFQEFELYMFDEEGNYDKVDIIIDFSEHL